MQTESPLHRPTHRPRVLSVASATAQDTPSVPTKSKLRRSLLGPISSLSGSDISISGFQDQSPLPFKDTGALSPDLPPKSPNRTSFRFKGTNLHLGSEDFNENPLINKSLSSSNQDYDNSDAEIDLTDGVSSGTQLYDSEKEYQDGIYSDTPQDSPLTQSVSLNSTPEQTESTLEKAPLTRSRKASFLEARKKFLPNQEEPTSPSSMPLASSENRVISHSGSGSSVQEKIASFDSIDLSLKDSPLITKDKPTSYSKSRSTTNVLSPEPSEDFTPRAVTSTQECSDSPVEEPVLIYQEPESIFKASNNNHSGTDEVGEICQVSNALDTTTSFATATIKEAHAEEVHEVISESQATQETPKSYRENDHSDTEGEFEICTIKKTEVYTHFPTGNSGHVSRHSQEILTKEPIASQTVLEPIYHSDSGNHSHQGSQTRIEENQKSIEAVHLQLTKLSRAPSEEGQENMAAFDEDFHEALVDSPPTPPMERLAPEPQRKPFDGLGSEPMKKSASENTHKYKNSSSMMSSSSQNSQESAQSEGGIMNKVRNLYDMFQTRSKTPTGNSSQSDSWGVSSLFQSRPRGMSDTTAPQPAPTQVAKAPEMKNFQYQNIPNNVRRLSLLDMTPPTDTRAASLYSVEELDADNVDWEFWGQLVNNFDAMVKGNYAVLQKSVRQGIPVSMRGMVWQLLADIRGTDLMQVYSQLLTRTSPHEKSITQDLPRTFPQLAFFKSKEGSGQESLFNVLKCYSLYDPEVGYCQGLSFLAGPLLLNMPDEEAFCVLVRMMEGIRLHFTPAMEGLQVRTYQFERLMKETLPQVHQHLMEQGIQSTMYASQWFMTMFAYRSSMRLVFRVLDILLLEGSDILIKVALALLKDNAQHILTQRFDDLIGYLKTDIFDHYQDRIDHLIALACDQKLSERRMSKWRREYMAEIAKKAEEEAYAASLQGVNNQLSDSNKDLTYRLGQLTEANQDLSNQLVAYQDTIASQNDRNLALEHKLNEMEALLHTERQRAEASLLDQMDALAKKNLSLVTKNAALEDALALAEDTIISLRAKLASSRP